MKDTLISLLATFLIVIMVLGFSSCGNQSLGMGNYSFTHIHIGDANGYCATVKSWHDNEQGIEVDTEEYGTIYCSEGTYILFEDNTCPYC